MREQVSFARVRTRDLITKQYRDLISRSRSIGNLRSIGDQLELDQLEINKDQ